MICLSLHESGVPSYGSSTQKIHQHVTSAVKKVARLKIWDSNHEGCDIVKVPIFKHLPAKRMIWFLHSLTNSCCNSISRFKYYFRYSSDYALALKSVFHLSYGIEVIFDNPLCALISTGFTLYRIMSKECGSFVFCCSLYLFI